MKLNLEAKTKEQQRIKAYLEENASPGTGPSPAGRRGRCRCGRCQG